MDEHPVPYVPTLPRLIFFVTLMAKHSASTPPGSLEQCFTVIGGSDSPRTSQYTDSSIKLLVAYASASRYRYRCALTSYSNSSSPLSSSTPISGTKDISCVHNHSPSLADSREKSSAPPVLLCPLSKIKIWVTDRLCLAFTTN